MSRPHFLAPLLAGPGPFRLRIVRSGLSLATHVELAGTSASRRSGLLGRDGLADGHALVIAPTQGIHTFGMSFALDVVAVARDGTVVKVQATVPARRLVFAMRAFAMVEMAAGAARSAELRVGDQLEVDLDPNAFP